MLDIRPAKAFNEPYAESNIPNQPKRKYLFIFSVVFVILAVIIFGFFYGNNISYNNPDSIAESRSRMIIEKVGKLVILPQDEVPTIATVSNPDILKNQPFFAEAKKGDQVLIYTNARKAILYDPTVNKIITMATLNIGDVEKSTQILPGLGDTVPKTLNTEEENQF